MFSGAQLFGWAAVLFNGCVAANCHDAMQGDQLGAGFIVVLALGGAVAIAAVSSIALGVVSAAVVWSSRGLRWVGIALVVFGLAAGLGAGDAVRSSVCPYTGGTWCGPGNR